MAAARVSTAARGARVEVVPNGVDAAWWHPVTARAGAGTRHPVHVVSAMRLVSRKRPLAALEVLHRARAVLDPAVALRATIVGEGPQRRLMERRLRTLGLDWVELPGRVDKEELRRLHHEADMYLTAARLEAFGIAPLEARAAGVPVVAPRGTGVDDFVEDGVDGLLADGDGDGDVALALALARLAGDDALRSRMRAHLLATPPAQSWGGVLAATLAEYDRAGVRAR
jgi:glycosyltransferase involved in cell wall biosynthesis